MVCDGGTFSFAGSDTCDLDTCPEGSANFENQACALCGPTQYQPQAGQGSCLDCPTGLNADPTREFCENCQPGEFVDETTGDCTKCPYGHYAAAPQTGECPVCSAGSKTEKELGAEQCSLCPPPYYSAGATTECNQCTRGFYYSLDEQCVACPFDSTDCPADGGSTQEVITIKPGYWRATATGQSFLACPVDYSCVGGTNFTDGGDGYCAKGHTGVLCAVCDDDYFYDKDQNVCSRCSNAAASQSLWTAMCVLVALSSAYVLWRSKLAKDTREASVNVFKRTKQKLNITAIMMQIATSMSFNLGIVFPVLFSEFLGAFDFVNINPFQVIAFNCLGTFNFYHTLLGMTLTPLAVCGLLMGWHLYKKKMVTAKKQSEEEATAEEEAGAEETKETEGGGNQRILVATRISLLHHAAGVVRDLQRLQVPLLRGLGRVVPGRGLLDPVRGRGACGVAAVRVHYGAGLPGRHHGLLRSAPVQRAPPGELRRDPCLIG